ncbi:MAG: AMP-binding protein, partial [Longimicrobiales bacterium]
MTDGIEQWAARRPDHPAVVFEGERRTYGQLDARQRRVAGLLASLGVGRGDRIAVLSANSIEMIEVTIGALRAGVVPVPVSPLLTPPEIHYLIDDSGAAVLFSDRALTDVAAETTVGFGADLEERIEHTRPLDVAGVALTRPMHYTSGTTGRPKGVWVAPGSEADARAR